MSPKGNTAAMLERTAAFAEGLAKMREAAVSMQLAASRFLRFLQPLVQPLAELEEGRRRQAAAEAYQAAQLQKLFGVRTEIQVVTMQSGGSRLVVRQLPRWGDLPLP